MQSASFWFRAASERRFGLIVAAILAVGVLAAGAALLAPSGHAIGAPSAGPQGAAAAVVPVGIVGDSAVAGDPSVPSAASVFKAHTPPSEEPVAGF